MLTCLCFIFFCSGSYFLRACFFVVYYIFIFSRFYMNTSVSPGFFMCLYFGFFTFMVCMLHGLSWYMFFTGWEMMGVFSFLLISWFSGRSLARNRASLAFLSNRFRDLLFFGGLLLRCNLLLMFSGGLTKSAVWLFSSWLPNAMEGPTPVSTLLHSSTMVVAGVFLIGIFNYSCYLFSLVFLLYGCYMGRVRGQFSDYKRVIAYSTSSQLALVGLISVMGSECHSLSYVEAHAYFKSLLFMLCRWAIHSNYVQYLISNYNYLVLGSSVFWCSCVMCGLPFFSVARIKDVLLIRSCFIVFYLIFIVYAYRTFYYSLLLRYARSYSPLLFLESRHIFSYYLVYASFNIYIYEIFGYRAELGRFLVFLVLLFPVFLSFLFFGSLNSSVDFYYSSKSLGLRLYLFRSLFSYGLALKDWSMFLVLLIFFI